MLAKEKDSIQNIFFELRSHEHLSAVLQNGMFKKGMRQKAYSKKACSKMANAKKAYVYKRHISEFINNKKFGFSNILILLKILPPTKCPH